MIGAAVGPQVVAVFAGVLKVELLGELEVAWSGVLARFDEGYTNEGVIVELA